MKCQYCDKDCKNANSHRNHERCCPQNPSRIYKNGMTGKTAWNKGQTKRSDPRIAKYGRTYSERCRKNIIRKDPVVHSEETKKKISEAMIKRHREGLAWNIGQSRWNNEPSYPETFFMKVIENEFNDKDYIRESPIGIYAADFCWEHLKKVIEIDGEQHKRFAEYAERDKRKDKYLESQGYEVLRIEWKEMFSDTKRYIQIAKDFIDGL